tara:strand:- start:303 stop:1277 length:975 start_codon:yes stop_codon:yes gene_type:complete
MAFLDNSGDIILDAVLTDTGRMRLAKGDGSFKIVKFALGDDEINYGLYRNANHDSGAHPSGSAYYDLDILQTPVLEAFTNNTSNLKSRLVTYTRLNLLNLPILKLNEARTDFSRNSDANQAENKFVITVDEETSRNLDERERSKGIFKSGTGMVNGINAVGTTIRIDQGLDTSNPTPKTRMDEQLVETRYMVEMDNRLGTLVDLRGTAAPLSFIDDDNIAAYNLSLDTNASFITRNTNVELVGSGAETIKGPRGTTIAFKIRSSVELQDSSDLFEKIGRTSQSWVDTVGTATIHYIDSTIRVTGLTTGYRIDIPVRFVKLASSR